MQRIKGDQPGALNKAFSRRTILKGVLIGGTAATLGGLSSSMPLHAAARGIIGHTREYWIQAESFQCTAIPSNRDELIGRIFDPSDGMYWALAYRAYTPNWERPLLLAAPAAGDPLPNQSLLQGGGGAIEHISDRSPVASTNFIPGPVIRGQVGDTILIHFRNNDAHYQFPHSIHAHGLVYTPEHDGAWIASRPDAPGTAVMPGQSYTYRYEVKPSSVGTWVYHDHSMPQSLSGGVPVMDISTQLGLFGLIAIDPPDAPPVDKEHILYFHQLYAADIPSLAQDFCCFNGAAFLPNTPVFRAKIGERVRWRIGALGQEFYVFHLHGHRWQSTSDGYRDTEMLGPSMTATIEYVEENPGRWFYHCSSLNHLVNGMIGQYIVTA